MELTVLKIEDLERGMLGNHRACSPASPRHHSGSGSQASCVTQHDAGEASLGG
jgi:hypothetical protein